MNVAVTLAADSKAKKTEVGDIVRVQLFLDEKVGTPQDGWEVDAPPDAIWLPAGGVTVSTASVRAIPADGNVTKLELEAMVHQPGPLIVGPLRLRNQVSKTEVEVPETTLTGTETSAGTAPKEEPPWLMPAIGFGGLDWVTVGLILCVIAVLIATIGRMAWNRLRGQMSQNLTHTERALNAIANLHKYSKSKKPLQLEEWKKFSFELAGILRKYSDENFRIDSSDMTDREFLYELRLHNTAAPWVNLISSILATITEVRYGKKELDTALVPGLLLDARKFVETTSVEVKENPGSEKKRAGAIP